ncbi:hypothetical protein GCM10011505_43280 [Tistrella bauzanensis]|uniref:Uncharacterized protein n=1 Tax=Tistrella bauzanensis TaxID=657419 RepID=A0ABQ1J391_9PROT|nr:hypothetical protein [Tistrella bauzanensis]GGB57743.1 hypothetical protein GCM10011505_43280 [Tistrella bauzanensis]
MTSGTIRQAFRQNTSRTFRAGGGMTGGQDSPFRIAQIASMTQVIAAMMPPVGRCPHEVLQSGFHNHLESHRDRPSTPNSSFKTAFRQVMQIIAGASPIDEAKLRTELAVAPANAPFQANMVLADPSPQKALFDDLSAKAPQIGAIT